MSKARETDPAELWERYCEETLVARRTPQGAMAFAFDALTPAIRPQRMWLPIETAPKDGTQVMLFFPKRYQGKGGISWGCFLHGDWLDSRAIRDNDPSHWMPMMDPPLTRPKCGGGS